MMDLSDSTPGSFVEPDRELGAIVVPLLKGVIYTEDNPALWNSLLALEPGVRDYVSVMGLELILDEAEGYAFLRSRPESEETGPGYTGSSNTGSGTVPRLVARRQLSYPVSLLLALLRKKLAESDVSGADTRMILSRDEVVEMVRIFLPAGTNEVKLIDNVDAQLNKIADLGFVRRLRGQRDMIEVRRIIKAFVDAQWLSDFDQRLTEYREHLGGEREDG